MSHTGKKEDNKRSRNPLGRFARIGRERKEGKQETDRTETGDNQAKQNANRGFPKMAAGVHRLKRTTYRNELKRSTNRRWMKRGGTVLACMVAFVTTYTLILPAITLTDPADEPGIAWPLYLQNASVGEGTLFSADPGNDPEVENDRRDRQDEELSADAADAVDLASADTRLRGIDESAKTGTPVKESESVSSVKEKSDPAGDTRRQADGASVEDSESQAATSGKGRSAQVSVTDTTGEPQASATGTGHNASASAVGTDDGSQTPETGATDETQASATGNGQNASASATGTDDGSQTPETGSTGESQAFATGAGHNASASVTGTDDGAAASAADVDTDTDVDVDPDRTSQIPSDASPAEPSDAPASAPDEPSGDSDAGGTVDPDANGAIDVADGSIHGTETQDPVSGTSETEAASETPAEEEESPADDADTGVEPAAPFLTPADSLLSRPDDLWQALLSGSALLAAPAKAASATAGTVMIHFVDREGNALSGVAYTGNNRNVRVNSDGTFTIPFDWGGATGSVNLGTEFVKTGYTYASTHLAGTRGSEVLTYDGLTIDATLRESISYNSRSLYFYTDTGDNRGYQELLPQDFRQALQVPNATNGNSIAYTAANAGKDVYVIMDPLPTGAFGASGTWNPSGSGSDGNDDLDAEDPKFSKTLESNEDGTYTLSLSVTGQALNTSEEPKANVLFVVDTSSSMVSNTTDTGNTRLADTQTALKRIGNQLLANNGKNGRADDTVEVAMISFDGAVVNELGWSTSASALESRVNALTVHRGTDWEDALKRAHELGIAKKAAQPDEPVFVIFFTDGEASQYTSFHGKGDYGGAEGGYRKWYSYFLSRESAKDEARAIINDGLRLYGIYAYNADTSQYHGERGSDFLHNLLKYGYNTQESLAQRHYFARASNTQELNDAFAAILNAINETLGFSHVVMHDGITDLTSTGIDMENEVVGGLTYFRSGGKYGNGQNWTDAPAAVVSHAGDGKVDGITWDLGSMALEDDVTYTVRFRVWPCQYAYDWIRNLKNGTKTWADVVAAGLDAPNGSNPQIVKDGEDYALLTNPPSRDGDGTIIHNEITFRKTHAETVSGLPDGLQPDTPYEGTDADGNPIVTTYTFSEEDNTWTMTVVTEKKTAFPAPDPMPLAEQQVSVVKEWDLAHSDISSAAELPADALKFRLLVDGAYYQTDGSTVSGEDGKADALALTVQDPLWTDTVHIAPGIVKFRDDSGNSLDEALVLETGHQYTLEEYDPKLGGEDPSPVYSFTFSSQTVRPMLVDGTLQYLILADASHPAPAGSSQYRIGTETWYAASDGSAVLRGTNQVKIRRVSVTILKTTEDGNTPLPGAVFDLYDESGWQSDPKHALQTGLTSSDQPDDKGKVDLGELTDGTYYLIETNAPDGFLLPEEPVTIVVHQGDVTYSQPDSSLSLSGTGQSGDPEHGYQLVVTNTAGYVLPSTGGIGRGRFLLAGALLVLAAGAGLLWKRGKRSG